MGRLPKYEPSVSLPTNVRTADFGQKSGLAKLGQQVGKVLQIRGEQLVKEYDTVKALSAYSDFSDSSMSRVKELTKLESGNAEGVQNIYKEWYGKQVGDFSNGLNSQPQQLMFKDMADRRRETDLNTLARHEATQYKVQKKETLDRVATNADSDIRAAVAEGLKTPIPDFTNVDQKIEAFMVGLKEMFPGHDLVALEAKYTQLFRVAQMEEMMEINPQVARDYLETYKDDLSFVENGILKDAYPALKSKLKEETFKDDINRVYYAQVALHPVDPAASIRSMTPERLKELGVDVAVGERVKNIFKSEIQWAENRAEANRTEAADITRNEIMEFLQNGDMSNAFKTLYDADHLSPGEQQIMYNIISARTSQYTDTELSETIDERIISGDITKPSQISIYKSRGLSTADTTQKMAMLKDHLQNPATMQFYKEAFVWYKDQFQEVLNENEYIFLLEMEPYLKSEILRQINDPKINLKGPDILAKLQEIAGSRQDLYREGPFSFLGYGEEKTKAPMQEMLDKSRKEEAERTKRHATGVTTETIKYADIPERIVIGIKKRLDKLKKDVSEGSIILYYQRNPEFVDKLNKKDETDIGVTF